MCHKGMEKVNLTVVHPSVQTRNVEKTFFSAAKKLHLVAGPGTSDHQNSQLEKLWEKLSCSRDPVTGCSSVQAILNFVNFGYLDRNDTIQRVLNIIPSAEVDVWLIRLVLILIQLQFEEDKKQCQQCSKSFFKSPYLLLNPTHPLISVVMSCQKAWPTINTEVQALLMENWLSDNVECYQVATIPNTFRLHLPFFLHCLCTCQIDSSNLINIVTLQYSLLNCIGSPVNLSEDECHCKYKSPALIIIDMIPYLTVPNEQMHLIIQQLTVKVYSVENLDSFILRKLTMKLFSVCSGFTNHLSVSSVINSISMLIEKLIVISSSTDVARLLVLVSILIAQMMCQASPFVLKPLLKLTRLLLSSAFLKVDPATKDMLLLHLFVIKSAVLQVMLYKASMAYHDITSQVDQILVVINTKIDGLLLCGATDLSVSTHKTSPVDEYGPHRSTWFTQSRILRKALSFEANNNQNAVSNYLNLFLKYINSYDMALSLSITTMAIIHHRTSKNAEDVSCDDCFNILSTLSQKYPQIALFSVPNLLYILKISSMDKLTHSLFQLLPNLVSHHLCVGVVLKVIRDMCCDVRLVPFAAKLMHKLWIKEPRCFTNLFRLITSSHPQLNCDTMSTVRALIVRDICKLKPAQHAGDMLRLIMTTISESADTPGLIVIAVHSLYYLCDKEIVSISSTWNAIKGNCSSSSSAVIVSLLKLLSLVPKLSVQGQSFVSFQDEALSWIWMCVCHGESSVRGAALVALTYFNQTDSQIRHLPIDLQPENPEEDCAQGVDSESHKFLELPVPGYIIVDIIRNSPTEMQEQCRYFLSALLCQELQALPRDIKDRAMKSQKASSQPSTMVNVPSFMLKAYEKNRQPNLRATYATSLLMCYHQPVATDRRGKPVPTAVISKGRNFLQILQALLSEVILDPKSWQNIQLIAEAWNTFMHRCFAALLASRRVELQLQLQKADANETEEVNHKLLFSHMWCRDKLTDILKTASKGASSMQGNAILALSGLMNAVKEYDSTTVRQESDAAMAAEDAGFLSFERWICMGCDTVISIFDNSYRAPGRILSWCQYRSVSNTGRLTTTQIGRVSAIQSLCTVVDILLLFDADRILQLIDILKCYLNPSTVELLPVNVLLHVQISCGKVVSLLLRDDKHSLISNMVLKNKIVDLNYTIVNLATISNQSVNDHGNELGSGSDDNGKDEERLGLVIAVGLITGTLFQSTVPDTKYAAISQYYTMKEMLERPEVDVTTIKALCTVLVWITAIGWRTDALSEDDVLAMLEYVENQFQSSPHDILLCECLGTICHCLAKEIVPVRKRHTDLYTKWKVQVVNTRLPTRQRLSAIAGLSALVGSERVFIPGAVSWESDAGAMQQLKDVVNIVCNQMQAVKDVGVSGKAASLLSRLYLTCEVTSQFTTSSMPPTFSYLPETSVLRPAFNLLCDVESSEGSNVPLHLISVLVQAFAEVAQQYKFPPVDWSPLLANVADQSVDKQKCLYEIAFTQSPDNPTCASFLSTWTTLSHFVYLHPCIKCIFYRNFVVFTKFCQAQAMLSFLEHCLQQITDSCNMPKSVLTGLQMLLDKPDSLPGCVYLVKTALLRSFAVIPLSLDDKKAAEIWQRISECVWKCGDVDDFLASCDKSTMDFTLKSLLLHCNLVRCKQKPLAGCMRYLLVCDTSAAAAAVQIVASCVEHLLFINNSCFKSAHQLTWLQEVMSCTKQAWESNHHDQVIMLLKIFSITVHMLVQTTLSSTTAKEASAGDVVADNETLWDASLHLLPTSLVSLLYDKFWKDNFSDDVISWLVDAHNKIAYFDVSAAGCVEQTLLSLQHRGVRMRAPVWRRFVASVLL